MSLVALDVAILPPPGVMRLAIGLSGSLPQDESHDLVLGPGQLPHITLLQQFVRVADVTAFTDRVEQVVRGCRPLALRATGGSGGGRSVWIAIERAPALVALHERMLEATADLDQKTGTADAFFGGDARDRDLNWVARYRDASSEDRFVPHITLGHAARPPAVEPFDFEATTVAVCHLGRFCTCCVTLREWHLSARSGTEP